MMEYKQHTVISKQIRKRTIISFTVFVIFIAAAILTWKWIRSQPTEEGAYSPLREVLDYNEVFFNRFLNRDHLDKPFPKSAALKNPRVNGSEGMSDGFDPATWRLTVVRKPGDTLYLTLDDIKALPKTEIIFDFKCIEGWNQVTHWAGVKFSDFADKYGLNISDMKYAGLSTPDAGYYVGIDMASMLHSQTILCYEMNEKPLSLNHGAPLRLIIPVKYGIKHLKRIGTIFFSNERPPDYWYERGYDYFSGL
jgi:DMSO/TMAO reductase YedYZ molybdopterin-dependent catalytic subunit